MTLGLAIVGYGKMGRLIEQLAPEHGFAVCAKFNNANNSNGSGLSHDSLRGAQVAIEFSTPAAAPANLHRLASLAIPTVVGTTGWTEHLSEIRSAVLAHQAGMVWSANFSIGANLFRQIVEEAARRFASHPEYGAWGWEIHHAAKRDAPSGTLLALAADMHRAGYSREISLGSNRAGSVPGTHEIGFDSVADTITLRHTARGREGFARGALQAARWIAGKKGFFQFAEILPGLVSGK